VTGNKAASVKNTADDFLERLGVRDYQRRQPESPSKEAKSSAMRVVEEC
jgi:hypothetical protein